MIDCRRTTGVLAVAVLVTALAATCSLAQGVTVAVTPASLAVAPGQEFDLFLEVTQSGSAFNGFDAVVGYDPAALQLIPLSPLSLQEGALMTAACPDRFHLFRAGAATDTITDVLLCSGVAVTGPGTIYQLHFRASDTPQLTHVNLLPGLHFYDAGLAVTPVVSSDATIDINAAVDVGSPGASLQGLSIFPNPFRDETTIVLRNPGTRPLLVLDARGRAVRHLDLSGAPEGARSTWNGRDDAGKRLPAGTYWLSAGRPGALARITLVR